MRHALQGMAVTSFDLAERGAYMPGVVGRSGLIEVLGKSPLPMRHLAAETYLDRELRQWMCPAWAVALGMTDAVVVGGGNLFSDFDLNLSLIIPAALDEVRRAGLPTAVL